MATYEMKIDSALAGLYLTSECWCQWNDRAVLASPLDCTVDQYAAPSGCLWAAAQKNRKQGIGNNQQPMDTAQSSTVHYDTVAASVYSWSKISKPSSFLTGSINDTIVIMN